MSSVSLRLNKHRLKPRPAPDRARRVPRTHQRTSPPVVVDAERRRAILAQIAAHHRHAVGRMHSQLAHDRISTCGASTSTGVNVWNDSVVGTFAR